MLATTTFAAFGFEVAAAGEGSARVRVPWRAAHLRPGGIVAGYILVAAADVAVWLAIKTVLGAEDESVTVDLHTAFLAAASSEFYCDARIVRCGRLLVTGSATCSDGRRELAQHTVTYARKMRPPSLAVP